MQLMDQNKLSQMAKDAGDDMLPMLVGIFVEELEASKDELSHCDDGQIAAIAHKVKGSAATFGAEALQDLCKQLEYVAKGTAQGDALALKQQCLQAMADTLLVYRRVLAQ